MASPSKKPSKAAAKKTAQKTAQKTESSGTKRAKQAGGATKSEGRATNKSGGDTRQRILDATIETLRAEGIAGASARAIARRGDFNQALIFYHFGDLNAAILAAVEQINENHAERYRQRLADTTTLGELVDVAVDLHAKDTDEGSIAVFVQAAAGAQGDPELGRHLYALMQRWTSVIEAGLEKTIADRPLTAGLSTEQMAFAIASLFMGMEILGQLDPDAAPVEATLESLTQLARVGEALLDSPLMASLMPDGKAD